MSKAASKSNLRLVEPPVVQVRPVTKANEAMHPRVMSESAFTCARLTRAAYYSDDTALIYHMDVRAGLKLLSEAGVQVNCVVTSPPFYGQRDYEVVNRPGFAGGCFA